MSTLDGGKQPLVSMPFKGDCRKCGARRIDRQLGLERTPEAYIANMVAVFREVWRVLRDDGTCWVNMGDGYASNGVTNSSGGPSAKQSSNAGSWFKPREVETGLKSKDLIGMPWRLAFALQEDGWTLRSEIIWQKPNPMPESVTDRPTKSHEQIFLFSKAKWVGPEQSAFAHISDEDARWLALLFDTEGNIVVRRAMMESGRTTYGLQVAFANTSRNLIDVAKGIVGIGSVHERPGKNSPMFYWQMTNIQASELMKRIYRFLIVKQRQARLGIYVQSLFETARTERLTVEGRLRGRKRSDGHTELLEKCWATMKFLNHFGTPDLSWVPEPVFGRWDSQPYYFDQEAVREPAESEFNGGSIQGRLSEPGWKGHTPTNGTRNIRSVWSIATQPYPEAHFATFPEEIPKRCILAGTSARGCCAACGAPWERVVEREANPNGINGGEHREVVRDGALGTRNRDMEREKRIGQSITLGFRPTCTCNAGIVPCTVLDPFVGSGTTVAVAESLGRCGIGLELSWPYLQLAQKRLRTTNLGLPL